MNDPNGIYLWKNMYHCLRLKNCTTDTQISQCLKMTETDYRVMLTSKFDCYTHYGEIVFIDKKEAERALDHIINIYIAKKLAGVLQ